MVQTGSAGKHWYTERVASVGLLALIPAGFVYPNPVVDYGLAVLIPLHGHWSVHETVTQCMYAYYNNMCANGSVLCTSWFILSLSSRGYMAIVEDYVPEVLKAATKGLVYMLSIGAFAGLMYLNVNDVGICGAVKAVWSL